MQTSVSFHCQLPIEKQHLDIGAWRLHHWCRVACMFSRDGGWQDLSLHCMQEQHLKPCSLANEPIGSPASRGQSEQCLPSPRAPLAGLWLTLPVYAQAVPLALCAWWQGGGWCRWSGGALENSSGKWGETPGCAVCTEGVFSMQEPWEMTTAGEEQGAGLLRSLVSQQNWKDGIRVPLGGGVLRATHVEKGSWPEVLKLGLNAP